MHQTTADETKAGCQEPLIRDSVPISQTFVGCEAASLHQGTWLAVLRLLEVAPGLMGIMWDARACSKGWFIEVHVSLKP